MCPSVCGFASVTEELQLPVNFALFSLADRSEAVTVRLSLTVFSKK